MPTTSGPGRRLRDRVRALTASQRLAIGWFVFLLYAYPGYMSFDSAYQLRDSRTGVLGDNHPPAMAALWRVVELFVTGPFGMLVIQSVTFLVGIYLLFRRRMSERSAATAACLVLLFPPVLAVMAVIWKDCQMLGFGMLGFGLILSEHRRTRLIGLGSLAIATAMRHNALVMTFPIVVLCFVWNPQHRFWKRHLVSLAAWIAITGAAQLVTVALTSEKRYYWHHTLALADMIGTLHYTTPEISDRELRDTFAGIDLGDDSHIHERARTFAPDRPMLDELWRVTKQTFHITSTYRYPSGFPRPAAERDAIVRAWKKIVFDHVDAYLSYRLAVFERLLGFTDNEGSPTYIWFTDVQDPAFSADDMQHDANPAKLQDQLRDAMQELGDSVVFRILVYAVLAVVLLPFALRDREVLALLLSAFLSEAALFVLAGTADWRYSFWLIAATVLAAIMLIARRVHPEPRGLP